MKKSVTLDDVLSQFNPYHNGIGNDEMNGALAVNCSKREAFNDLFVTIMDPEHDDVREWGEARWRSVVALAQDLNSFLRALDDYYKQQAFGTRKKMKQ